MNTTELGIHTYEAFFKINKELFDILFELFKKYAKNNNCCFIPYPSDEKWEELKQQNKITQRSFTLYPKIKGLNISLVKTYYMNINNESSKSKNYYLRYIVTPYDLLNGTHFHIYTEDNFTAVSNPTFNISVNVVCLSSEDVASPVNTISETVKIDRAFLPSLTALAYSAAASISTAKMPIFSHERYAFEWSL